MFDGPNQLDMYSRLISIFNSNDNKLISTSASDESQKYL